MNDGIGSTSPVELSGDEIWTRWTSHCPLAVQRGNGKVVKLVGQRGFEPPTPTPPAWCATRLRHCPTVVLRRGGPSRLVAGWGAGSLDPSGAVPLPDVCAGRSGGFRGLLSESGGVGQPRGLRRSLRSRSERTEESILASPGVKSGLRFCLGLVLRHGVLGGCSFDFLGLERDRGDLARRQDDAA